jgi:hypothetical protein
MEAKIAGDIRVQLDKSYVYEWPGALDQLKFMRDEELDLGKCERVKSRT